MATPKDVLAMLKEDGAEIVDVQFFDLPGPGSTSRSLARQLDEGRLRGRDLGFDGSSIRGFQKIHESDMLLVPDPPARSSIRSAGRRR